MLDDFINLVQSKYDSLNDGSHHLFAFAITNRKQCFEKCDLGEE